MNKPSNYKKEAAAAQVESVKSISDLDLKHEEMAQTRFLSSMKL
jgi:hypothetical protein